LIYFGKNGIKMNGNRGLKKAAAVTFLFRFFDLSECGTGPFEQAEISG
jgi:hypothetical protein